MTNAALLQCGHDPEAVESRQIIADLEDEVALQCGHDPEAVESPLPIVPLPTTTSGFNAATTRRPWRTAHGGAEGNGNYGFNAATTRRPWRASGDAFASTSPGMLQCGHDPEAVESPARRRPAPCRSCFNAATTRRPWRAACGPA